MLNVAIDARSLNRDHVRGIGRYSQEVMTRVERLGPVHCELLSDRPDLPLHAPQLATAGVHVFVQRGHRFHAWEQFALPNKVRQLRSDVLHCPGMRLPLWQPVPTIVTLHDAMPWLGNECDWPRGWYRDVIIPRALKKCAAIITISEHSRRDILKLWPSLEPKLHLIRNGVSDHFLKSGDQCSQQILRRLGLSQPYFLYVGGTIPRKRVEWAIRVFRKLDERGVTLALCGLESEAEQRILMSVPCELRSRIRILPFIDDQHLPYIYRGATAILYPTLYEGFGLPVVEAHAVGTPILFSNVGSLSELNGPGAFILPVEDLDAWVTVCRRLLTSRRNNPSFDAASRPWAKQFSWEFSAQKHLHVYQSVARSRVLKSEAKPASAKKEFLAIG